MINYLIVTSEFKFSGPNNVINSLINGCDDNSNFYITALRKKYDDAYISELDLDEGNIYFQKRNNSLLHLFFLIKTLRPKIVNTHGIRADIFVFLLSFFFNFKQVSTIHNLPNEDYIMRYGNRIGMIMLKLHSIVFRSPRVRKIAVSIYSRDNLIKNLSATNVDYIYNGVDSNKFKPSDTISNGLLPRNNRKKVLFCGHLSDIKNPLIFVKSAYVNTDIDYILLGSGPLDNCIKRFHRDNIYLMGRVNNVVDYLNQIDLFVMPSKTEGMPMAFIEAMLMNLPIVCSDIPIFEELSSIPGLSAKLFKKNDINDLSEKIRISLEFRNVQNRAIALEKFSASVMAKQYLDIFNE
ncbi:glycosyltransferase family 4 protein [Photobacterium leiognathi]|uniref:glycosyltransferase family 4 protein n=1 Tax=Photobacterium leiognathi TaxID=553611 RepID=UPI0029825133|nr:glycosyltransferase family 4 protein [Photobacterium leiognathi]